MPTKKKPTKAKAKKKPAKKTSGGIAAFVRKVQNNLTVKSKTNKIKDLEKRLKALKKEKASAVKKATLKLKKTK
jgi:hypothetical protein